jgi:hypothetical protein
MKMMASYVSAVYGLTPDGMDLEGAVFENVDEALCQKIVSDIETRFRRQLKYIEAALAERAVSGSGRTRPKIPAGAPWIFLAWLEM